MSSAASAIEGEGTRCTSLRSRFEKRDQRLFSERTAYGFTPEEMLSNQSRAMNFKISARDGIGKRLEVMGASIRKTVSLVCAIGSSTKF